MPSPIVTTRPPRRRKPTAAAAQALTGPRIVIASKPGRNPKLTIPDEAPEPEADARVRAFFRRMGIKAAE